MASELVCTAKINHRNSCNTVCGRCRFLLADRRRELKGSFAWLHRVIRERRVASNRVPYEYELSNNILREKGSVKATGSMLLMMIALLISFNVLDSVLTIRALSLGVAEANPVMAGLFEISLPLGIAMKFAVVAAGSCLLWKLRQYMLAIRGVTVLTGCYGLVVAYHLVFQLQLLGGV